MGCEENISGEVGPIEDGIRLKAGEKTNISFKSNVNSFNVVDRLSSSYADKEI